MGNKEHGDNIYPGSGPLEEVKLYVLLDYIDMYMMVTELIYHEIG